MRIFAAAVRFSGKINCANGQETDYPAGNGGRPAPHHGADRVRAAEDAGRGQHGAVG